MRYARRSMKRTCAWSAIAIWMGWPDGLWTLPWARVGPALRPVQDSPQALSHHAAAALRQQKSSSAMTMSKLPWTPDSWRARPGAYQPRYASDAELAAAVAELERLPPLVTSWEIDALKSQLAAAARGERFLLQGGDCAERFDECTAESITNKLKILLQMSLVLVHGARKPVIRIGRFAGQYAKPRSEEFESRGETTLLTYRGDLINRPGYTEADRAPDARLLLRGYERSALTLNFIRALVRGGFADLQDRKSTLL